MTEELYKRLSKYEEQLTSAHVGNYVRKLYSTTLNELDDIYKEMFPNAPDSKLKTGCSSCVLKAIKKMAVEYFNYKPEPTKVEETKVETETEITEDKPITTNGTKSKSKSGTKSKSRKSGKTS